MEDSNDQIEQKQQKEQKEELVKEEPKEAHEQSSPQNQPQPTTQQQQQQNEQAEPTEQADSPNALRNIKNQLEELANECLKEKDFQKEFKQKAKEYLNSQPFNAFIVADTYAGKATVSSCHYIRSRKEDRAPCEVIEIDRFKDDTNYVFRVFIFPL